MFHEAFFDGSAESDDREHRDRGREDCMRHQNPKINRAHPSGFIELNMADGGVVDEIANQKHARDDKGGPHRFVMRVYLLLADKRVTDNEQNRGGAVQRCIDNG